MGSQGLAGRGLVWAAALAIVTACSPGEPEQQIRARIAAAEAAAEARDIRFFRALIADGFLDQRGNDRQALLNLIRSQFLLHQRVEIIALIESVAVEHPEAARATLTAGMVGSQAQRLRFGETSADLYRLELEWIRASEDWQLIGARWAAMGER